ncbi:MAG: nitroreductase family protein [Phocaeicola sp.]|uniref:nitroreductase family protein n=1 Tax=Phocaeicola sp. TaxID=2773926 RepID=UPI0023BEC055|nr:nitroreductase family protein [Phocaeicola sp.]MDE5677596.1 nitroreductase family protein [Phocaeicola sp.]MDE6181531.1 nitroreductase family protein [Phocaeicola sp.]
MKRIRMTLASAALLLLCGCNEPSKPESPSTDGNEKKENAVIETMMARRSIRKYLPHAVGRDTMQVILNCGINAPNGQNKQSWEIRVVDNPDFINGVTEVFKQKNPKMAEDPNFKNMFRNAPTVVFIANDLSYDCSQIDCGLLGENMILAAQSMGIGSCCLASPTRFMNDTPEAAEYLKKLDFPEGYQLLYCIAFGYPDETPAAKPRKAEKIRFID